MISCNKFSPRYPNELATIDNKENIPTQLIKKVEKQPNLNMSRSFGTPINLNITNSKSLTAKEIIPSNQPNEQSDSINVSTESKDLSNSDNTNNQEKKKRRERTTFSKNQITALQELFRQTKYPDVALRENLSTRIGIPETRIQVWFKNRRAKNRKENSSHSQPHGGYDNQETDYCYNNYKSFASISDERNSSMQINPNVSLNKANYDEQTYPTQSPSVAFPLNSAIYNVPSTWFSPHAHQTHPFNQQNMETNYSPYTQSMPYAHMVGSQVQNYPQNYMLNNSGQMPLNMQNMYLLNQAQHQPPVKYYPLYKNQSNTNGE